LGSEILVGSHRMSDRTGSTVYDLAMGFKICIIRKCGENSLSSSTYKYTEHLILCSDNLIKVNQNGDNTNKN